MNLIDDNDPLSAQANIDIAVWILDLVQSFDVLPHNLEVFTSKLVLNPLLTFIHKTENRDLRLKLIGTIKNLLLMPKAPGPD
jgi:hypothetical protein